MALGLLNQDDCRKSLVRMSASKTFKEVLFSYETSAVIGLMKENGDVLINPSMDVVMAEKDNIIVIAEDDDTILISEKSDYEIKDNLFQSSNSK